MAKLPGSTVPPASGDTDAVSKEFADANYAGGSSGIAFNTQSLDIPAASNQHLSVADNGLFAGLSAMTIELWVGIDVLPSGTHFGLVGQAGGTGNYGFALRMLTSGHVQARFSTDGSEFTGADLSAVHSMTVGNWYHLAAVWDGATGNITIYQDGVVIGGPTAKHTGLLWDSSRDFQVAKADDSANFFNDNRMSELRIWNTARTGDQIRANMQRAMTGAESGLITLHHLSGDYLDSSPSSYDLSNDGGYTIPFIDDIPFNADERAVHDNVAGEINAIASKATPVAADVMVIEDSAAAFVKKKIDLSDLINSTEPVAAAQGAYLGASLSATITASIVVNDPVIFDQVDYQRGDLSLDDIAGKVDGLKAGRTYKITAVLAGDTDPGQLWYGWYDSNTDALLGTAGVSLSVDSAVSASGQPTATAMYTPSVDTSVELRVAFASPTTIDISSLFSNIQVVEIGAVQANVVGGLELMDIIDVTVATDTVSFGAAGDGAFQRALDGDVDEEYFCSYYMPGDHGGTTYQWVMQPNGVSTAQQCAIDYSGASAGKITATNLQLADGFVARDTRGTFTLFAKTGRARYYDSTSIVTAPGGGAAEMHQSRNAGTWDEQVTNITSIVIAHTDGAVNYILPGAQFALWRRTRTNLRADSAAVYERMAMETVDPLAIATTERTVGHTIYGGSLVGVSLRVEDAVTAGDITVNVKIDGVTALTAVLDTTNSSSHVVRAAVGLHKFAADKNISVEFVPTSYDNAGSLASAVTVQVHLTNDALITQNDRVVARDELTANGDTISLAGLNGDLDGEYEVVGRLKMNTTSALTVSWLPNGLTTDMSLNSWNDGNQTASTVGVFLNIGATTTSAEFEFRARFWVERGVTRRGLESIGGALFNVSTLFVHQAAGFLLNDTDNITSLDFVNSVASGFLAGSWVEVRRIKA